MGEVNGYGRIWRLMHDTTRLGPQPRMFDETPAQLVAHLAHPNGWWRDTAQKLLILRQDQSVVPALKQMVFREGNVLARIHSLWTLEGLSALDGETVRRMLGDKHPKMRQAAIRASESVIKSGDVGLKELIFEKMRDPDPEVSIQAMLSSRAVEPAAALPAIERTVNETTSEGVREIGRQLRFPFNQSTAGLLLDPRQEKLMNHGREIYNTLCVSCHGIDAKGAKVPDAEPGKIIAPRLWYSALVTGSPRGAILPVLHGMTGRNFPGGLMIPLGENDDDWIASVVSFIRNSFGNSAGFVYPEDVAAARAATPGRNTPWKITELQAILPRNVIENRSRLSTKMTASHGTEVVGLVTDRNYETKFISGAPQQSGMWIQAELPTAETIVGLTMEAGVTPEDFPRQFKVAGSMDGVRWTTIVLSAQGKRSLTQIDFPPSVAKFLRITLTASDAVRPWSIHELQVFATPRTREKP